ncbi:universal stress protein [Mycobacterium sp. pR1184]|uniref:universal stress protein n=1 Tax=Mycobacterium sp. pR1184 TaxID=3238981 RepID=UPI00351BA3D6
MFDRYPPKSVVVGVDGSAAAIRAARWAVDEVAGTDIPLRLLYVTQRDVDASPRQARLAVAAAEHVVRDAYEAVEQVGKPVKVETEILDGEPVAALIAASRSTTLLCVGDTGASMRPTIWLGSTAKELAQSGHCSVAVVRASTSDADTTDTRSIVAFVDESPDGMDVLELAIHEARHRGVPLRVLTSTQSRSGDSHLKRCTDNYPEVEFDTVHLQASLVDYLAVHAEAIQLIVVGAAQTAAIEQLLGAPGAEALRESDLSLLVVGFKRPGR